MAKTILAAFDLAQRYGAELIFSGASFQMTEKERIALVGPNGSGKSSLLKILAGLAEPAEGSVATATGIRVAYQAQEAAFRSGRSLYEEALDAYRDVREIGARISMLEQEMSSDGDTDMEELFDEYSRLSTEFEARHGYEMEHRSAQVLSGLGFPEAMFDEPVKQLSGGQKTRVALAKALLSDPDLLLLDEPTNHLDLEAIEWLEEFLQAWNRAFIVVSHDRYFLDKVTERTIELTNSKLDDYPSSYVGYLRLREERRGRQRKEYEEQQEFIARTEEFIRKYKAGQRSREARGRETRLARLERLQPPVDEQRLNLNIRSSRRSGRIVLSAEPLTVGYPASGNEAEPTVLCTTDELIVERRDRVALIGPNGAGKTTVLRTFIGDLPPLKGRVRVGTNVESAYYAQGHEGLDASLTVLESILRVKPIGEEVARTLLGSYLFSDDDVYKRVFELSGGERSRLALARLALEHANFLILDEPTNHLDILARETLEDALSTYDGTIVFVSHDRFFINKIASRVWSIEDGRLMQHLGNYDDMLRQREKQRSRTPDLEPTPESSEDESYKKPQPDTWRGARRQFEKQVREANRRLTAAERNVSKLEERLNVLYDEMSRATISQDVQTLADVGFEIEIIQRELEIAYDEWGTANANVDQLAAVATPGSNGC